MCAAVPWMPLVVTLPETAPSSATEIAVAASRSCDGRHLVYAGQNDFDVGTDRNAAHPHREDRHCKHGILEPDHDLS
jgi:hypothetical protein